MRNFFNFKHLQKFTERRKWSKISIRFLFCHLNATKDSCLLENRNKSCIFENCPKCGCSLSFFFYGSTVKIFENSRDLHSFCKHFLIFAIFRTLRLKVHQQVQSNLTSSCFGLLLWTSDKYPTWQQVKGAISCSLFIKKRQNPSKNSKNTYK